MCKTSGLLYSFSSCTGMCNSCDNICGRTVHRVRLTVFGEMAEMSKGAYNYLEREEIMAKFLDSSLVICFSPASASHPGLQKK